MPIWIRRVIFWTFVMIFFITAPLLVLYTAGYRYSISSGLVTRTGVLSITTSPRSAEIYLDSQYAGAKTPEVLKRILPGTYGIELRKDGYHSWTGEVEIKSGQTKQLQNIQLFLDSEAQLLFDKETDVISVNPQGDTIAYATREGGWQEIWLYRPKENSHTLLNQQIASDQKNLELAWSAAGTYLSAFDIDANTVAIYKNDATAVSLPVNEDIIGLEWNPSSDALIALTTEDGLVQIDLQAGLIKSFAQTDETSVLLDASVLRLISGSDYTEIAQYVDNEKETLALLPKGTYTIEERDGTYLILTDTRGRLYLIQIHQDQPILLEREVDTYDWDPQSDRLVFTDGFELSVYDASSHITELITRQSTQIKTVTWHPQSNIVFVQDDALRAYETYAQAKQRFVTTLLENADIQTLWISKDGRNIYFYGQQNGAYGVYSLEIAKLIEGF
ncbi:MAG: Peptidase S8 and S53, subtilisin, kexin, sedolisin [Candidatus Uhrbacteria bacterium GW2011_GWD2_41_121]|uniref:PEGA domain-containing protein n=1 Tax=Candidatus Uhrbacteria bacterium GW2011_GWC1_41_20 TaxID=1618983 RepID=A0A0G0VEE5_9BACT|nr:MAG: Peptidase S8 and S53, subtilisin, kexin, sedolisin [Candidatus Uhrbacteria bacterium GW2011_GWE1_39_46]KKR63931.1 MAG: Peptidase S8 and S53, subtilisin, kexin, sedolisin [Candidatus Uhrbacteria bacterium GW2011_GWC2_40_450]KKR90157.1 MAG: Peptidase S8 and S53, subtilisin, kexin, sedolisin [Candidatus Uhrbacteria bacterium GW2011_GWD2_41_121]KKR96140.1 MAG: Peptidase S8 and S53, subtilisin, kexin, sedolisin [Candidatus Uhrbacteria bacterium GW2011_GWD1_41_16]KKR99223.1 MAG: hypothetical 